jgi:hypothetical protein
VTLAVAPLSARLLLPAIVLVCIETQTSSLGSALVFATLGGSQQIRTPAPCGWGCTPVKRIPLAAVRCRPAGRPVNSLVTVLNPAKKEIEPVCDQTLKNGDTDELSAGVLCRPVEMQERVKDASIQVTPFVSIS